MTWLGFGWRALVLAVVHAAAWIAGAAVFPVPFLLAVILKGSGGTGQTAGQPEDGAVP